MSVKAQKRQKVIILGGGFGGVYCARYLRKFAPANVDIELISQTNYFVFQPLLPEVASGIISAPDAVTSLRLLLPKARVRMAEVIDVDLESNWVHILQGSKRLPLKVGYDHLVIAFGQKTDLSRFPGFEEHSRSMRDLADAHSLRNHIIQCLEHADITEDEEANASCPSYRKNWVSTPGRSWRSEEWKFASGRLCARQRALRSI